MNVLDNVVDVAKRIQAGRLTTVYGVDIDIMTEEQLRAIIIVGLSDNSELLNNFDYFKAKLTGVKL